MLANVHSQAEVPRDNQRLAPRRTHPRWFALNRLRRHMEFALQRLPDQSIRQVLDYGCGGMPYRPLVQARWPQVSYHGADLPQNPLAQIHISETGQMSSEDAAYDLVLSTQVLEHVTSPVAYLREAHRVLRPGGYLLLSTHGHWMYHPDPTDFWRWTGDGLRKLITDSGFGVDQTLGVGNLATAGVQLFQDATLNRCPRVLSPAYAFVGQRVAFMLSRMFGGDSEKDAVLFLIVARRNT